ncbi:MAG: flagellin [Brevundimonas sp.]|uniref:flagellin n=1 Tax=Brevundimonas sp. TaxID=1871086 RepID=UPI0040333A0F
MASINTNVSAQVALQNMNAISDRLTSTQNRVSTGLKVGGAKDNAAVWAVAQNQRADTKSYEAVTNSLNRATSIADVSIAAGESISDLVTQLKEKATAAADPGGTAATRTAYNNEFQALLQSIAGFAANATFDGQNILDGTSTAPLQFLANADASSTIDLDRQDLSLAGLGLNPAPDLTTVAGATTALATVTTALATVNANLAELGAQATRIENHTVFVSKLIDSLETGVGNLVDADLAKESAKLQALQVQQQLSVQALSIANQAPQIILSLFQN